MIINLTQDQEAYVRTLVDAEGNLDRDRVKAERFNPASPIYSLFPNAQEAAEAYFDIVASAICRAVKIEKVVHHRTVKAVGCISSSSRSS
jgi:hypothetical protein